MNDDGFTSSIIVLVTVVGLLIGSFLNVVIARLPAEDPVDRNLNGRSRCPKCRRQIAWYDNVPLLSWLVLRGRCRSCGEPISPRYPFVEALTAAIFGCVALAADTTGELVRGCVLSAVLVAITFIDLDHRIIPNAITLPGTVVGLALSIGFQPHRWDAFLIASLGAGAFLFVTVLLYPRGMGMGDVKMALLMGAFLGPPVVIGMFAGFLLGAVLGVGMLVRFGSRARKMAVPFGPFLAGGAVIAWFWGQRLLDAYLDSL